MAMLACMGSMGFLEPIHLWNLSFLRFNMCLCITKVITFNVRAGTNSSIGILNGATASQVTKTFDHCISSSLTQLLLPYNLSTKLLPAEVFFLNTSSIFSCFTLMVLFFWFVI